MAQGGYSPNLILNGDAPFLSIYTSDVSGVLLSSDANKNYLQKHYWVYNEMAQALLQLDCISGRK